MDLYKTLLSNSDYKSLEERAKRLEEITSKFVPYDIEKKPPLARLRDYRKDAEISYVNGNFRSCIFSCACIIEQIFRHEYMKIFEDREKALKRIEKVTFGHLISRIEELLDCGIPKLDHLAPFIEKAKTINKIRNKIAVHPGYVDLPLSSDWGFLKKLMREEILFLFELMVETDPKIKPEKRKAMLEKKLNSIEFSGDMGYEKPKPWKVTLKDMLDKNFDFERGFVNPRQVRSLIEENILKHLALRSYKLMNEIVGGIYDMQKDVKAPRKE